MAKKFETGVEVYGLMWAVICPGGKQTRYYVYAMLSSLDEAMEWLAENPIFAVNGTVVVEVGLGSILDDAVRYNKMREDDFAALTCDNYGMDEALRAATKAGS